MILSDIVSVPSPTVNMTIFNCVEICVRACNPYDSCHINGLMEALGGLGSLGDSGGLACRARVGSATASELCRIIPTYNPTQ